MPKAINLKDGPTRDLESRLCKSTFEPRSVAQNFQLYIHMRQPMSILYSLRQVRPGVSYHHCYYHRWEGVNDCNPLILESLLTNCTDSESSKLNGQSGAGL